MQNTHVHRPQYTTPGLSHLKATMSGNMTPMQNDSAKTMPGTKDVNLEFN